MSLKRALLSLTLFAILSLSYHACLNLSSAAAVAAAAPAPARGEPHMADVIAIKEGADLDLSCPIVVPSEDMIISWTCDDEPANIRSSRIHVTELGKLRIRSAKVGDSCNYRCEAADGFGTLSVIIKVIIVDKKLVDQLSRQNKTSASSNEMAATASSSSHRRPKTAGRHPAAGGRTDLADGPALQPAADTNSSSPSAGGQDTLEVQIEPATLRIDRNRTFTLECRVKHSAPQQQHQPTMLLPPPQIIWLKEFIGHKPDSPTEAHEKNLVLIDDVYYHSLNWPRSITRSNNSSSTTNSALLIRQSNSVHSGKYVCFAGYPPYTLSPRLTATDTSGGGGGGGGGGGERSTPRYKMATAEVQVDDAMAGQSSSFGNHLKHALAVPTASSTSTSDPERTNSKYLLVSIISSDTWARNVTIILIIFCGILYVLKLFFDKYRRRLATISGKGFKTNSRPPLDSRQQQQQQLENQQICSAQQVNHRKMDSSLQTMLPPTNLNPSHQQCATTSPDTSSMMNSHHSTSVPNIGQLYATSRPTPNPNPLPCLMKQLQPLAKIPTSGENSTHNHHSSLNDEHLYSEISDRLTTMTNDSEQSYYYKVPVRKESGLFVSMRQD